MASQADKTYHDFTIGDKQMTAVNSTEVQATMEQIQAAIKLLSGSGVNMSSLTSQLADMDRTVNTAKRNEALATLPKDLIKGMIVVAIYDSQGVLRQDVAVSVARAGLQVRIQPSDGTHYNIRTMDYTPRTPKSGKARKYVSVTDWGKLPDEYRSRHENGDIYTGYPGIAEALQFTPAEHTTSEQYRTPYIVLFRKYGVKVKPASEEEVNAFKLRKGIVSVVVNTAESDVDAANTEHADTGAESDDSEELEDLGDGFSS